MPMTHRQKAVADQAAMVSAVRGAIAQAGLTQAELADEADIAINTLSRRLNGWSPFTWPEITAIAAATKVSAIDLASAAERISQRTLEDVPA